MLMRGEELHVDAFMLILSAFARLSGDSVCQEEQRLIFSFIFALMH